VDHEFWLGRWRHGQTGWHQSQVHPLLERYWSSLRLEPGAGVFVPLCGKSLDMRWLRERGHPIVGIDLSPLAAEAFFAGQHLQPRVERRGPFEWWSAAGYAIAIGDFFELTREELGAAAAFYDRAALIALPPSARPRYMQHLAALLPDPAAGLLIGLEYEQSRVQGPPFSVSAHEIVAGFDRGFTVAALCREAVPTDNPRFLEAGVSTWTETAFRLDRSASLR
jgi:thiopurine S-methyltransferase